MADLGKFINWQDCEIVRGQDDYPGMAILFEAGEYILAFSEDTEDRFIETAVRLANKAYRDGFSAGPYAKLREIKKVLEII